MTTDIRNIAIIAHVDHGKTTLVDELFQQSGMFGDHEAVEERMMDSMDLERERGITISAKNGAFEYNNHRVNIIDTPGHADFGGQVERVLRMADGALLVVDAQEGPMPQTYFVVKKALARGMPIIVIINKVDKPAARPDWAIDEVFDLFVQLDAPEHILEFPIVYASAKFGWAAHQLEDERENMKPLFDAIIEHVPPPSGDPNGPLQLQVASLDYSPYLGRLGIGKITSGRLSVNEEISVVNREGVANPARITKVYRFQGNQKVATDEAELGELVAIAGKDDITVGVTYTSRSNPIPLPPIAIDPPTISMRFVPNDSPFAGREGKFVTSRQIEDRLRRETLSDVALEVTELTDAVGFRVAGRGELHLSILIERLRREGFELQVGRPQVITKEIDGKTVEPYEDVTIDVPEEFAGTVIDKMNRRRGRMQEMKKVGELTRLIYRMPTRGLLGFRSEFLTDTKGMGTMYSVFAEYGEWAGELRHRETGVLVAKEAGPTAAYAIFKLQDRGTFFVGPQLEVYVGQILGENARANDLWINACKGKKLTNVRASGSDDGVQITPPRVMSLEDCLDFIEDDELLEVTPASIRLRKVNLRAP